MCGRFSFAPKKQQTPTVLIELQLPEGLVPRYNIAPTEQAWTVLQTGAQCQWQALEWGLVPYWSADGKNGGQRINARAESLLEKPSFQTPVRTRRCAVPADSFYEWKTLPGKQKAPYRIFRRDGELLWMAGVWDEWGHGQATKRTFSIITTAPNAEMSDLHDRMPALLLQPEALLRWIDPNTPLDAVLPLLVPAPDNTLERYRVSEKLNKAGFDAPSLHDAVPEQPTLF